MGDGAWRISWSEVYTQRGLKRRLVISVDVRMSIPLSVGEGQALQAWKAPLVRYDHRFG